MGLSIKYRNGLDNYYSVVIRDTNININECLADEERSSDMNISNAEDDSNVSKNFEEPIATAETDIAMKNIRIQRNESNSSADVKSTFDETAVTEGIAVGELKDYVVRKRAQLHTEFKVCLCLQVCVPVIRLPHYLCNYGYFKLL